MHANQFSSVCYPNRSLVERIHNLEKEPPVPLCSVIIPVYNRAFLTRQCLDRLLADPLCLAEWEIIVVDDASTDTTPALLASYGDSIHVVAHQQNVGFA